jgi:hypothetical protein
MKVKLQSGNTSVNGRLSRRSESEFCAKASVNGKVPVKYLAEYPLFLKPNKHYPCRRLNDSHVERTMKSALDRYEKELLSLERE